jgi:DNA-binding NarL/FixJ family response regulator
MTAFQPVFSTREPLRIGAVRELLLGAGVTAEPKVVYPDELERVMMAAGICLAIIDGDAPPSQDVMLRLRRASPGSLIVIWAERLTTELLLATIECTLDGLLSSKLPPEDAAYALSRICHGERLLRFDAESVATDSVKAARRVAGAPSFDAQWMLDGGESPGREK